MDTQNVSLAIALVAGFLSFASPCVLPLVPAYLGYLSGAALGREGEEVSRFAIFLHALSFVLGFSTVFVALGASASSIGRLLGEHLVLIQKVGGLVIIVFGLHTMGVLKIPLLYQERRFEARARPRLGYLSSFLVGLFFAAGWTPCVGPVLSAIFLLATDVRTVGQGICLLGAYSLGLGLPFLLAGLALEAASSRLRRLGRHLKLVSIISGLFLIAVGLAIFTGSLGFLARYGGLLNF